MARPRWDRLHADPNATSTALALSQALINTDRSAGGDPDLAEVLDIRARLAEKAGDVETLADTFAWMGIRHLFSGATTLGLTLLQATAALGREHQLPVPLTRALVNLTANAITNDAEEAVQLGQEARTVAQRAGVRRWVSIAALNLGVAQFVRGEWDGVEQLITSDVPWEAGMDSFAISAIDTMLALARGTERLRHGGDPPEVEIQPGTDQAWALFDEALRAAQAGESAAALGLAVSAVKEYDEIFDDFLHMWALAMELAMACDDRQVETELLDLVDSTPVVPPLGLRAHRARFGALVALRDEDVGADETEVLLRRSVDLYLQWGALAYRARAVGELGGFLTRQGRPDDAGPLLDEARQFLVSIGAQVWLDELDLALVGGR